MRRGDAFGHALVDWARGGSELEMYERDDGFIEAGPGPALYLAEPRGWPMPERRALPFVRGRALDVGCGAGRVALALQERGVDVMGVDASDLAVRAARLRGVGDVRRQPVSGLAPILSSFDTVVLFGNNFGIFGTPERVRAGLTRWARHAAPGTRLLAESTDPAGGGVPACDAGHRRANRARGDLAGQLRLRIRYRDVASPWFPWLFVSPAHMRTLVAGTGWRLTRVLESGPAEPYVGVLERTPI